MENQVGEGGNRPLPVHAVMIVKPFVLDSDHGVLHALGNLIPVHPNAVGTLELLEHFPFALVVLHLHGGGGLHGHLAQLSGNAVVILEVDHHVHDHHAAHHGGGDHADEQDGHQALEDGGDSLQGMAHGGFFHHGAPFSGFAGISHLSCLLTLLKYRGTRRYVTAGANPPYGLAEETFGLSLSYSTARKKSNIKTVRVSTPTDTAS